MKNSRNKKVALWFFTGVLLIIFSAFTTGVSAIETGGYVVEPAYGISPDYTSIYFGELSGDYDFLEGPGPEQIGFWDLPLVIILILLGIGIAAFMIQPLKLFLSGKIALVPGLSRLKKTNLLDNESRRKVYDTILQNPGIQLCEIEKKTDLTNKNAEYHVKKLLGHNMIVFRQTSRGKGYFKNSDSYSSEEKLLYIHSKNPTEKRIIEIIHENPGITRKELSERIHISAPSISWYIAGLIGDNIIRKEKKGNRVHYYVSEYLKNDLFNIIGAESTVA